MARGKLALAKGTVGGEVFSRVYKGRVSSSCDSSLGGVKVAVFASSLLALPATRSRAFLEGSGAWSGARSGVRGGVILSFLGVKVGGCGANLAAGF